MIRIAHLGDDGRTVVSISIQSADWAETADAIASDTANIGDVFDGASFVPRTPPKMNREQWLALAHAKIEEAYGRKRVSMASYYTMLDRAERRGDLSADQKADLALLDAAQLWEQAMLDAGAKAATRNVDPSSCKWPPAPSGLAELVALS